MATIEDRDFEDIVANLNFDMIASPNYVRFVYDGDGYASEEAGPESSAFIEWLFTDYFMDVGLASNPLAFDGRSDYGPFIENGIPAGGLFTGAEGVKSEEEASTAATRVRPTISVFTRPVIPLAPSVCKAWMKWSTQLPMPSTSWP